MIEVNEDQKSQSLEFINYEGTDPLSKSDENEGSVLIRFFNAAVHNDGCLTRVVISSK